MCKPRGRLDDRSLERFAVEAHNPAIEMQADARMIDRVDDCKRLGRVRHEIALIYDRIRLKAKHDVQLMSRFRQRSKEIDRDTIGRVVAAGVEVCVVGSAIFAAGDPLAMMSELRQRARPETV